MNNGLKLFLSLSLLITTLVIAQAPTITSVDPNLVVHGELYNVMIYGGGFLAGMTSDFGSDITVTGTIRLSASLARADIEVLPTAALGARDVYVTNISGESDTLVADFFVVAEGDPPDVTLIWPACGDTTGCIDSAITVLIEDVSGIDESTIEFEVNSTVYTTASPALSFDSGTGILRWLPAGGLPEGIVSMSLLDVADVIGNHISGPAFDCTFMVDTAGPTYDYVFPPPYSTVGDLDPIIYFMASDDFAGYDTLSISVTIDGDTYVWGDSPLRFRNDTIFFYTSYSDLSISWGDTIDVCFETSDLVPGSCGPNSSEYCFYLIFEIIPPEDMNLTIESINPAFFPLISAYCLVNDEEDAMIEGLNESNFRVWTDGVEQYPLIVQSLGGGGAADIVWCIDTTGSMYSMFTAVTDGTIAFATALAASGIDYRLGLVTFADHVNFPYGYDLTGDVTEFHGWMSALGSGGGGDGPEVSFDAIVDAIASMSWRPGAKKVICMVSDAPYHYLSDGTAYSDAVYDDVYSSVMSDDVMMFVILKTSYTDPTRPYDGVWYGPGSVTEESGGAFYDYTAETEFDTILTHIVENIRGGYYVRWSTGHPVAACDLREVEIEAHLEVPGDYLSDDDVFYYWAPCSPEAAIVEPHPDTISTHPYPISNRELQQITVNLQEIEFEDSIDIDRLQFIVNSTMFTIDDLELDYYNSKLIFTPRNPWTHGEFVNCVLARVMDTQGNLPYGGPLRWTWRADLEPPQVDNLSPAPAASIIDHYAPVSCRIRDDLSGVNEESIIMTYQNREARESYPPEIRFLNINSDGVTWDGTIFEFDPAFANPPLQNADGDSICVSIARVEDMPDYVDLNEGPNASAEIRWCFVVPDDDTLCPEFYFVGPRTVNSGQPFYITMTIIDDQSGVYDPSDPSDPQGIILQYDIDGDLSDGYYSEVPMSHVAGDTFRTDYEITILDRDAFVFMVYACDNDTDGGYIDDRSCCWSDTFRIGRGPVVEVQYPLDGEVSTNEDQQIAVYVADSADGVDEGSIIFGVNGIDYEITDPELRFENDTLFFDPSPSAYFNDNMWVACSLKVVFDNQGFPGDNAFWQFFVDLTPPEFDNPHPPQGEVVIDLDIEVTANLWDELREVDSTTIEITINDTTTFVWGDPGIHFSNDGEFFAFRPREADYSWDNNDSICVSIIAADLEPDYGDANLSEPFRWCFFPSVTSCNYYPNPFTPNGDGINDVVIFTYPYMALGRGIISIFDLDNNLVYRSPAGTEIWDGRMNSGDIGSPGLYLFTIDHDGENICSGTILLSR